MKHYNPYGAKTEIFWAKKDTLVADDALAPYVARPPVAILLALFSQMNSARQVLNN